MSTMPDAKSGTAALPPLVPTELAPVGQRADPDGDVDPSVIAVLSSLVAVEIHDTAQRDSQTVYEIRVFLQSTRNRIPVAVTAGILSVVPRRKPQGCQGPQQRPDVVVSRGFAEFRKLRDAVYYAAQEGHPSGSIVRSCAFCAGVVDSVLFAQAQPHWYHQWLTRSSDVCTRLDTFLNDLVTNARGPMVTNARGHAWASARPRCAAPAAVQALVIAFLEPEA